jgi:hypothetical protein
VAEGADGRPIAVVASGLDVDIWRMPDDWPRAVAALSFGRASPEQSLL